MHSHFWLLFKICLIGIISLFTPPITSNGTYLVSYISGFLLDFQQTSVLILLYIQHIYVFYPDECANVDASIMRRER